MTPGGAAGELAETWQGESPATWSDRWGIPELRVFRTTPSSNDVAMQLAEAGAPAGSTVIADTQTAGRGQHGRQWSDGGGRSLLLSVVLRSPAGHIDPSTMPIRVGYAVARVVEQETGVRAWLKWPNDIVVPGRGKLGGILCEGATGGGAPWIVAGIGINVDQSAGDFAGLGNPVVSLAMCGAQAGRADLAGAILRALAPFEIQPPPIDDATLRSIRERDALFGLEVSIDGRNAGTAEGIDPQGRLMVRSDERGDLRRVITGTVRPLKRDPAANETVADQSTHDLRLQSEAPR